MPMTREEFIARADWAWVRAGVLESRAETEMRIAQVTAEIRAQCRPPRLREQEELAAMQAGLETIDWFLERMDRNGL
jgi:hypothetical protein